MSISFYDASVASYLQILAGVNQVLDKGEEAAAEGRFDLEDIVHYRLRDDMAPFSFQLNSVCHHSMGALKGCKSGVFEPPPKLGDVDWPRLRSMVGKAHEYLAAQDRDEVDALGGQDMVFRMGGRDIPFTTENFVLSFSLPNLYFHATTTYAVLRIHGAALGKIDYLGPLRITR
jgi:hypothetical protein